MADTITAELIKKYLEAQNDFDLELFVYRFLRERGVPAHHAGTYVDPWLKKPRQYDVRGTKIWEGSQTAISLAIECKSLSPDFPLIVSAVPRPLEDSYHELVLSGGKAGLGGQHNSAIREGFGKTGDINSGIGVLYRPDEMVGKKTAQVGWDANRNRFTTGDSESYDKWSQALASAAGLIEEACGAHRRLKKEYFYTLVLPILVVSDSTLWLVPYSEEGERGEPSLVPQATLFVGREYPLDEVAGTIHISHLHIYTRTGFVSFIADLTSPDSSRFWERTFGRAIRERFGR